MLSASSDPYYVAKEEVAKAMQKLQGRVFCPAPFETFLTHGVKFEGLHPEWRQLLQTENTARSERFKELHADLAGTPLNEMAQ